MTVRYLLPAACGCPGLGWDLNLHPKQLQAAYWQDKNSKYTIGDIQVWYQPQLNAWLHPASVDAGMQAVFV